MNNPPAFPQNSQFADAYSELRGMTLRDYFAAAAMQALLPDGVKASSVALLCKLSYGYADAMLKAREG